LEFTLKKISQVELVGIELSGRKYTWSNNHVDSTYELFDRVLISAFREENFTLVPVSAMSRDLSDHMVLLISTGSPQNIPKQFKFGNCWFLRDELTNIVNDS
jgi:hypothetical protein